MFIHFKQQILKNKKNLLLLSMSVADLCVGIAGIGGGIIFLFMMKGSTTMTVYKTGGILHLFGSFFMSILPLGIITAERLVAIKLLLYHRFTVTRNRIKVAVGMCWLFVTVVITIQGVLFVVVSAKTELQVRCLLLTIFFIAGTFILLVSNTVLYKTVQRRVVNRHVNMVHSQTRGGISQDSVSKERYSVGNSKQRDDTSRARICIWMTAVFIMCWLPVTIYYILWFALSINPAGRLGLIVCFALVGLNSVLNPVIYLLQRKDFRFYFRKIICRKFLARNDDSSKNSTSG